MLKCSRIYSFIFGHLSHSDDLLQVVFVCHRAFCLTILHFKLFVENYKANCYYISVMHLYGVIDNFGNSKIAWIRINKYII